MLEDFRSVRRWLIVLGTLAVLAAGVAAYALVKASESDDEAAARERVVRLERTLDARLAELGAAIDRAGKEADIVRLQREVGRKANAGQLARLDRRLRQLENDVASALDASADTSSALDTLTERVDALESRPRR